MNVFQFEVTGDKNLTVEQKRRKHMLKIIFAKYHMALNSTLTLTKPNLIDGMNKILRISGD